MKPMTRPGVAQLRELIVFGKFCLVGLSGVGVDMLVLHLLYSPELAGWGLTASKIVAAEVAIANNFIWNDRWTFREQRSSANHFQSILVRFVQFNCVCLFGLLISIALLNFGVRVLGMEVNISNGVAIVVTSFCNYKFGRKLSWRTK